MRISDWSSDVCSSDLVTALAQQIPVFLVFQASPMPNIGLEIIEALGKFRHTTLLIAGTAAASRPKSQVLCTFAYCNRFACIFVSAAPPTRLCRGSDALINPAVNKARRMSTGAIHEIRFGSKLRRNRSDTRRVGTEGASTYQTRRARNY